jgi:hypothetical protein
MNITVWILFIVFSFIGLTFLRKFIIDSLNMVEIIIFFISILISALGAGYLFGGLRILI